MSDYDYEYDYEVLCSVCGYMAEGQLLNYTWASGPAFKIAACACCEELLDEMTYECGNLTREAIQKLVDARRAAPLAEHDDVLETAVECLVQERRTRAARESRDRRDDLRLQLDAMGIK